MGVLGACDVRRAHQSARLRERDRVAAVGEIALQHGVDALSLAARRAPQLVHELLGRQHGAIGGCKAVLGLEARTHVAHDRLQRAQHLRVVTHTSLGGGDGGLRLVGEEVELLREALHAAVDGRALVGRPRARRADRLVQHVILGSSDSFEHTIS
eukprot:2405152-Prymnesium_polylepis.2